MIDIYGLQVLADADGIQRRCESLLTEFERTAIASSFFDGTEQYALQALPFAIPPGWRCPDALA